MSAHDGYPWTGPNTTGHYRVERTMDTRLVPLVELAQISDDDWRALAETQRTIRGRLRRRFSRRTRS